MNCLVCNQTIIRLRDPVCERCKTGAVIKRDKDGRIIQVINALGAAFIIKWTREKPSLFQDDDLSLLED